MVYQRKKAVQDTVVVVVLFVVVAEDYYYYSSYYYQYQVDFYSFDLVTFVDYVVVVAVFVVNIADFDNDEDLLYLNYHFVVVFSDVDHERTMVVLVDCEVWTMKTSLLFDYLHFVVDHVLLLK